MQIVDYREAFSWRYEPQYDPDPKDVAAVPSEVAPYIRGEDYVWQGTQHLPGFKDACITYWQECVKLSRRLVRIFALCLDLPEDYFDSMTTYPGSDGVFNYYPAMTAEQAAASQDVGLGSHTDLQCFTLLWQDMSGGLQVLTKPETGEGFIISFWQTEADAEASEANSSYIGQMSIISSYLYEPLEPETYEVSIRA